jgi:hypothetical protein
MIMSNIGRSLFPFEVVVLVVVFAHLHLLDHLGSRHAEGFGHEVGHHHTEGCKDSKKDEETDVYHPAEGKNEGHQQNRTTADGRHSHSTEVSHLSRVELIGDEDDHKG